MQTFRAIVGEGRQLLSKAKSSSLSGAFEDLIWRCLAMSDSAVFGSSFVVSSVDSCLRPHKPQSNTCLISSPLLRHHSLATHLLTDYRIMSATITTLKAPVVEADDKTTTVQELTTSPATAASLYDKIDLSRPFTIKHSFADGTYSYKVEQEEEEAEEPRSWLK
jgi:hypothetical protein